jgi:hypothetical protein
LERKKGPRNWCGMVGLWEDLDSGKKVVVKQAGGKANVVQAPEKEAKFLQMVGKSGSQQIIDMIGDKFYKDRRQSGIPGLDVGDVARLYLEFCEGGDFAQFLRAAYKYVWQLIYPCYM